jgi:hypothetical protein
VPDESTVRKLVKRLGADVIDEITMAVVQGATAVGAERRFVVRAARIDSTVVESDIRYPTDLGLAQDATRMLTVEASGAASLAGEEATHVVDRSRSIGKRLRRLNRSSTARTGQSKELALRLTALCARGRPPEVGRESGVRSESSKRICQQSSRD